MKQINLLTTITLVLCLLFTSCQKEYDADTKHSLQVTKAENLAYAAAPTKLSPEVKAKLAQLRSTLPAGYEKRLAQNAALTLKYHPEYQSLVFKAAHLVEETPCDGNTVLYQWLNNQLSDWDGETIFWAAISGMLSFPTYDALLFQNNSANQYFGVNQEYTHSVTKSYKDLQRFWNIQSNDIVLEAMHGNILRDRNKLVKLDMILFGDNEDVAEYWADLILMLIEYVPQYRKGDHPIFTFNSFAQPTFDFPPYGKIPKKIVMGDGIIEAFRAIGYGDVAPQAITAHEFGHQIQFQLNLFGTETGPEATRRTELMADAYASYYLSHSRGASMQWKRVKQYLQVFFNIGDCSFSEDNHHGTPTQRMAAAEWGYHVADNAQKQGHIMSAQKFTQLFEAALPQIIRK